MGTAHIEVGASLRERLMVDSRLVDQIRILDDIYAGDGFYLLKVSSPLLPVHCEGMQELVIDEHGAPRFKPARDV